MNYTGLQQYQGRLCGVFGHFVELLITEPGRANSPFRHMDSTPTRVRTRQLSLFPTFGPLTERLGAEFFASVPDAPGVYRFFGDADRLLYIGQSSSLRARIGSYRYVTAESHPRRIVRMVSRAHRIEWEICESPAAAIALEARLLLEHAPPANRAGTWMPPPWWLNIREEPGLLHAHLRRSAPEAGDLPHGPLPSSFPYTFAALMRCIWRCHWPETAWWDLPCSMARAVIPPQQAIPLSGCSTMDAVALRNFVRTGSPETLELLVDGIDKLNPDSPEGMFWTADGDELRKYSARLTRSG